MEDQERDMGSIEKEEVKERSQGDDLLTIMIFKKAGKLRTIKMSSRLLLGASAFLFFYIVATIFLTNAYFDAHRTTKIQASDIAALTGELANTRRALERSRRHFALLEGYLQEEKEQTPEPMSTVDYTESSVPQLVDINDLKVTRDHSELQVDFKIVNAHPQDEPVGGYIFVLASVKDSEKSEVWVYPSVPLKNGRPVEYSRGHRFFIHRFKKVTGNYTLNKAIEDPLVLEILVYDRNGGLILKRVVEV
jgi:hypothetical protein